MLLLSFYVLHNFFIFLFSYLISFYFFNIIIFYVHFVCVLCTIFIINKQINESADICRLVIISKGASAAASITFFSR